MSRKSNRSMPTVISETLYTDDQNNGIWLTERRWAEWLATVTGFYYQHGDNGFSVRKQAHRNGQFWYAYKRINGKLHKKYVGKLPTAENLKALSAEFSGIRR